MQDSPEPSAQLKWIRGGGERVGRSGSCKIKNSKKNVIDNLPAPFDTPPPALGDLDGSLPLELPKYSPEQEGASQSGIWVGIFAIHYVSFAAFTSALFCAPRESAADWTHIALPPILYGNTLALLLSSATLQMARRTPRCHTVPPSLLLFEMGFGLAHGPLSRSRICFPLLGNSKAWAAASPRRALYPRDEIPTARSTTC